jgi:hypothetical protein
MQLDMSTEFAISLQLRGIIEEISFGEFEGYIGFIEKYSIHSLISFIKYNASVFEFFRHIWI